MQLEMTEPLNCDQNPSPVDGDEVTNVSCLSREKIMSDDFFRTFFKVVFCNSVMHA